MEEHLEKALHHMREFERAARMAVRAMQASRETEAESRERGGASQREGKRDPARVGATQSPVQAALSGDLGELSCQETIDQPSSAAPAHSGSSTVSFGSKC